MERHSKSHAYTVRMKKNSMGATIVVILLSVVLIAGIIVLSPIGDYLTEHLIQPTMKVFQQKEKDSDIVSALNNHDESKSMPPSATPIATPIQSSLNIIETPFYILQMGVFTEQEQAQEHAQKLRAMGAAGLVYPDGSVYRVFAAAYLDDVSLQKVQSQVQKDGFEATPYITDQNTVHIILKGDTDAVHSAESAILLLSKIPTKLSELSLMFDKDEINDSSLKESLSSLQAEILQSITECNSLPKESIEYLRSLLEKYQNRISTFLNEHDTISMMNAGELKLLQLECISDYILFFERK